MSEPLNESESMSLASGIAAFEAKEFRRAWQLLQPLADRGSADALYRCAIMSQNGLGVVANLDGAASMMGEAANQGLGIAQHVETNIDEAVRLLNLAGDSGLMGAWATLGMIYNEGRGVDVDKALAREYYEKAGFDPDEIV